MLLVLSSCSGSGEGDVDAPLSGEDVASGPSGWLDAVSDRGSRPLEGDVGDPIEDAWSPTVPVFVCSPGETRCLDQSRPQTCAEDGASWLDGRACPPGGVCNPATGDCELTCTSGDAFCATSSSVYVCTDEGYYEENDCAESTPVCGAGDTCALCELGVVRCLDDENMAVCGEDGMRWLESRCSRGTRCWGASCLPCGTGCLGTSLVLGCPSDGAPAPLACAEGEICVEGQGCVACLSGDRRCLDERQPQVCNEDASAWLSESPCGDDEICRSGACEPCVTGDGWCLDALHRLECVVGGANPTQDCGERGLCAQGRCVHPTCASEVVLLIDRSGSMSEEWQRVQQSVESLFASHPDVRFGLLGFRSTNWGPLRLPLPPAFPDSPEESAAWFAANLPEGGTPLAPAIVRVAEAARDIWTLDTEHLHPFLVVLSDGEGNECAEHTLPLPEPADGDCLIDDLAAGAAWLRDTHGVRTMVVGYQYEGSHDQLLTLVENGGMSFGGYAVAGDEASLTAALNALFDDPKYCL